MRLIAIMILTVIVSCKSDLGGGNFNFPEVLDTLPKTEIRYSTQSMKSPINDILAIGDKDLNQIRITRDQPISYAEPARYKDTLINKSDLQIFVDTENLVTIDLGYYEILPPTFNNENSPEKKNKDLVQALNVYVVNSSEKTAHLDHQSARLIMIQEAKDELGVWRPIEFWKYHRSGTPYGTIELTPDQFVISKILKYDGEFETDIRLKLKNGKHIIYSAPFRGTINTNQFNLPDSFYERQEYMQENISLDRIFLN